VKGDVSYAIEMGLGAVILVPIFMRIGVGIQAILRFRLRNLRGCTVGITDERDFLITPLRWA
jgi:hypothetical protein